MTKKKSPIEEPVVEFTEVVSPEDEHVAELMSHTIDVSALASAVTKQKAADAAERRSNQQDAEHEFKLRQRDLKMDVFKAAYKGQTIKEKKEVPPSTIGQYFKKAVGGADLSKLKEASGRLGHPLSEAAAWTAMRDPSNYLKGLAMPPDDTPQPAPPQTYTSPKPSYLGDMLSKAGEAIGGVEIPGTGKTIRRTREVAPAIESAYSIGDLVDNVMDVPGMTEEHMISN